MIRISIDTETGGYDSKRYDCLSIGYVVVTGINLRVLEKGEILIQGRKTRCTREALLANKINLDEHNLKAVTPKEAAIQFDSVVRKYFHDGKMSLIGQNPDFDIGFLTCLYKKAKLEFIYSYRLVDLVLFWRCLEAIGVVQTKSASLDSILNYLKLPDIGQRHSALVDAENVIRVLRFLKKKIPKIQ